jgi:uncharacterized OB-fold protein
VTDTRPFTADSFHLYAAEKKLMGSRCENCGALYCPPRAICIKCGSDRLAWQQMSGKGKIATYSVILYGPMPFIREGYSREKPHCSGVIELEEGVNIAGQITGVDVAHPENIKIGTPVTVDFVERGSWHFIEDVAKVRRVYPVFRAG